MQFDGDVAWVTGGSKGIGRATSMGLAERGCNVVVHYNSSEDDAREVAERVEAYGRDALLARGDVTSSENVGRIAREIEDRYGRLDILVNNAGSMVERLTLAEMTEEVWDRLMEVNLKSVYLCSQAALPMMNRRGKGRIINMSSVSARSGGSPSSVAYATAKGGVSTLTRAMAEELAPDGILVKAVAPGRIDTPFHDEFTPTKRGKRPRKASCWGGRGRRERPLGWCCSWPLLTRTTSWGRSSK